MFKKTYSKDVAHMVVVFLSFKILKIFEIFRAFKIIKVI